MLFELILVAHLGKLHHTFVSPEKYWGAAGCNQAIERVADDLEPKRKVKFAVFCRRVQIEKPLNRTRIEQNIIKEMP